MLNAHRVPADRTLAHRVLIVDGSQENRLVLRAALERRGMQILEADAVDDALRLADRHRPDLIVVDLELDQQTGDDICGRFDRQGRHTPLVLLGSARRREPVVPMGQFVAKPYHYGPLIRTIEGLLDRSRQADCD